MSSARPATLASASAAPTLTVTVSGPVRVANGCSATAVRSRSAAAQASSRLVSGSMIANSSPPIRAATSESRVCVAHSCATATIT